MTTVRTVDKQVERKIYSLTQKFSSLITETKDRAQKTKETSKGGFFR